ncbi:MAG: hypothetical protein ACXVJC_03620 [Mucilaginibacter sp.]
MRNVYAKKHSVFTLDGVWLDVLGEPETHGLWLIWGREKNGKTWVTLLLSNYLSKQHKVHYISAEEGTGKDFTDTCARAQISPSNKSLAMIDYESVDELNYRLKSRKSARIVVIDNITVYADELKNGGLQKLLKDNPEVLFIMLAHEDRGEPYTATAKLAKRLAKRIFYVEGLTCSVSGRGPGGRLLIDEEKAALYHGNINEAS